MLRKSDIKNHKLTLKSRREPATNTGADGGARKS